MYFGSVRFFKHLIVTCVILVLIVPYIAITIVSVQNHVLKSELRGLNDDGVYYNKTTQDNINMNDNTPSKQLAGDIPYQKLYPDLKANKSKKQVVKEKTVYLTFDDGPSKNTEEILKILKKYNIKATFFVTGKTDEESKKLMKQIVTEGHTIAIHTYSHSYNDIYSSIEAFLHDFKQIYDLIYEATGVKCEIFRFPGGSINPYNNAIYQELISEMLRRGFTYYDWNVCAEDSNKASSTEAICNNVINNISQFNRAIVIAHDANVYDNTVKALPTIIDDIISKGYTFEKLTTDVKPIFFTYKD